MFSIGFLTKLWSSVPSIRLYWCTIVFGVSQTETPKAWREPNAHRLLCVHQCLQMLHRFTFCRQNMTSIYGVFCSLAKIWLCSARFSEESRLSQKSKRIAPCGLNYHSHWHSALSLPLYRLCWVVKSYLFVWYELISHISLFHMIWVDKSYLRSIWYELISHISCLIWYELISHILLQTHMS